VGADNRLGTGGLTFNGGALAVITGFSSTKTVALTGAGTIDVASGQTLTLSGVISGSAGLSKTGAGTLTLSGSTPTRAEPR
jgi:fibronectin-binding autotransporter adhesin